MFNKSFRIRWTDGDRVAIIRESSKILRIRTYAAGMGELTPSSLNRLTLITHRHDVHIAQYSRFATFTYTHREASNV